MEISMAGGQGMDIVKLHDMETSLSSAQRRILETVARFRDRPAFVPDVVKELGFAAESSLTPTLKILERKGLLAIDGGGAKGRSRVLRLTAAAGRWVGRGGLPVLGSIPAGPLSEALAETEAWVDPEAMLPWRAGDFLLRVQGTSMIGDGILDGDKVLIRPGVEPHEGEIAAVLVGDAHEATLKRVFSLRETGQVRLRASNPGFLDLVVPVESLKVAGVFRGLIRDGSRPGQ
jgi:repressor LexA